MFFSEDQLQRYSRHMILPEVGVEGQENLLSAKVLLVGVGGLGSPAGYYLAAAGIGALAIVDNDVVELSNLQRQIAHSTKKIDMSKVASAKDTFEALNPDTKVTAIKERITKDNIEGLIRDCDIVVDCSDNFATRFLINDACVLSKKRLVSGAILRFEGQLTTILPGEGHCYRCLFEEMPPADIVSSLQTAGLVGAVPGVIGSLQALEVIKLIVGKGSVLKERLLIFDGLKAKFRRIKVQRNPECPVCGDHPTITTLNDREYGTAQF
jgi:molybdopterin/thiamine biosynthesis adenylyltransferase